MKSEITLNESVKEAIEIALMRLLQKKDINKITVTELCETCLKGDFEKAREIHYRLMPFFKAAFVDGNPTSIKYAMKVKGLPSGGMRLPLVEVNDKAKEIIKKALEECNL